VAKEHEVSEFLHRFQNFGISEVDFHRTRELLTNKSGYETADEDAYWVILNQLVGKFIDEPYTVSKLFFQMRDYLVIKDKNPRITISEGQRWYLKGLLEDDVENVVIRTANDNQVCPECRSLHGIELEIMEAFHQLPVPSKCTSNYCRCSFIDPHELSSGAMINDIQSP
jgi:hypothetical protein